MENEIVSKNDKSGREVQTLFRSVYRNQNNLIQVADSKANLIIGITTMIISSVIAISGFGIIAQKMESANPALLLSLILIITSCLISAVLAIQATRPKIILKSKDYNNSDKISMLFFGQVANFTQQEYLDQMEKLLTSKKDIYEHMLLDIYHQGVILKKKYDYLKYAYAVFLFGLISSVIVFVLNLI